MFQMELCVGGAQHVSAQEKVSEEKIYSRGRLEFEGKVSRKIKLEEMRGMFITE